MNKLNCLEEQILSAIAVTHPYSITEVVKVYSRCKSFDITIKVLEEATANGISWECRLLELGL